MRPIRTNWHGPTIATRGDATLSRCLGHAPEPPRPAPLPANTPCDAGRMSHFIACQRPQVVKATHDKTA